MNLNAHRKLAKRMYLCISLIYTFIQPYFIVAIMQAHTTLKFIKID